MSAAKIREHLNALKNPKKAKLLQGFFKTGPGQYGEGDVFLGITVPEQRKISKIFFNLELSEFSNLIHSKIHEERLTALIILSNQAKFALKKNDMDKLHRVANLYLNEMNWINNWDLVDTSATHVLGPAFFHSPQFFKKEKLMNMIQSKSMWERRIAVLTSFYFIRQNQFQLTIDLCKKLLTDKEDLMHKACGWMLREIGKKDQKLLILFLNQYSKKMPRTMLRYSIEKLNKKTRQSYLKK